ncbi:MAG: GMC family oxidoreductase N-terminal domain-containing protein [Pseudomonadota bacterium]|nr:GMC family oxidoreductase N-terminal domain-containing protein [Pseudomonadota bacterium]
MNPNSGTYDYIIVGAGSAGCVLANRLTENPDSRVLLIEAGPADRNPMIKIPLLWMQFVKNKIHDWGYDTQPEPYMDDREIECVRGKVLGGCSSINAMTIVRGNRNDYERWKRTGLNDWGFDNVLPYFKKLESWEGETDDSDIRGLSGPLKVCPSRYQDPLYDAYLKAATQMGMGLAKDYNGEDQLGLARSQQNIFKGRRFSAADAFLRPALRRPNLEIKLKKFVTRLIFDGQKVIGVELAGSNGQLKMVRAESEVILSAGAINSPHLLMLSGIGSAGQLEKQDIEVVSNVPEVGQNLQDHMSASVGYRRKMPGPFLSKTRFDRLAVDLVYAYFFGTGVAADFPGGLNGFTKVDVSSDVPDTQLLFNGAPAESYPWLPLIRPAWRDGFGCRAVLLHPESRGSLELVSNKPEDLMFLRQNFLATDKDRRVLREGFKICRELSRQSALDPFRSEEYLPGENVKSDDDIDSHIRATGISVHHPCGTCRMGNDERSVVDPFLKVRGIERLRVVDASVMPDIISGNIHAPVLMIAERAADFIKEAA